METGDRTPQTPTVEPPAFLTGMGEDTREVIMAILSDNSASDLEEVAQSLADIAELSETQIAELLDTSHKVHRIRYDLAKCCEELEAYERVQAAQVMPVLLEISEEFASGALDEIRAATDSIVRRVEQLRARRGQLEMRCRTRYSQSEKWLNIHRLTSVVIFQNGSAGFSGHCTSDWVTLSFYVCLQLIN